MLCQFSVGNFRSIRDTVTLDMQAASISEHGESVFHCEDGEKFLPIAVIYGPNGGGKSNILLALTSLIVKVVYPVFVSTERNDEVNPTLKRELPLAPFKFSEDTWNAPTEFELFFRTDMAEYRYALSIKNNLILSEDLAQIKFSTGRRSTLFKRKGNMQQLLGSLSSLKLSKNVSETLPLISYLAILYEKNPIINDVFTWFRRGIATFNYGFPTKRHRLLVDKENKLHKLILAMMEEMGLDIVEFRMEEKENDKVEIFTTHEIDHFQTELKLAEESSGTIKLFHLLPIIAESLLTGRTLIIDELDANLHPLLLKHIIRMYTNPSANKYQAQLIFTSHDLTTMNSDVFRRDEIWFMAKGASENSQLYSLVEFRDKQGNSVRKDAKYDKQYLEGKYGADPYLKRIIDWENQHA